MSKNWYAEIKVAADETTPVIKFHIGKTSSHSVSVDGNLFGSFAEMTDFLRYNESKATIVDEYGVNYSLDELIEIFNRYSITDRARQYRAVGTESGRNRLDKDGFTVSTGEWF
jgi:hypothetical protein